MHSRADQCSAAYTGSCSSYARAGTYSRCLAFALVQVSCAACMAWGHVSSSAVHQTAAGSVTQCMQPSAAGPEPACGANGRTQSRILVTASSISWSTIKVHELSMWDVCVCLKSACAFSDLPTSWAWIGIRWCSVLISVVGMCCLLACCSSMMATQSAHNTAPMKHTTCSGFCALHESLCRCVAVCVASVRTCSCSILCADISVCIPFDSYTDQSCWCMLLGLLIC